MISYIIAAEPIDVPITTFIRACVLEDISLKIGNIFVET